MGFIVFTTIYLFRGNVLMLLHLQCAWFPVDGSHAISADLCFATLSTAWHVLPPSFYSYTIHGYNIRNVSSGFVQTAPCLIVLHFFTASKYTKRHNFPWTAPPVTYFHANTMSLCVVFPCIHIFVSQLENRNHRSVCFIEEFDSGILIHKLTFGCFNL